MGAAGWAAWSASQHRQHRGVDIDRMVVHASHLQGPGHSTRGSDLQRHLHFSISPFLRPSPHLNHPDTGWVNYNNRYPDPHHAVITITMAIVFILASLPTWTSPYLFTGGVNGISITSTTIQKGFVAGPSNTLPGTCSVQPTLPYYPWIIWRPEPTLFLPFFSILQYIPVISTDIDTICSAPSHHTHPIASFSHSGFANGCHRALPPLLLARLGLYGRT